MDDFYTLDSASFIFTYVCFKSTGIKTYIEESDIPEMHKHVIKVECSPVFLRPFDHSFQVKHKLMR